MGRKIEYAKTFRDDLTSIGDYILNELSSPQAARNTAKGILEATFILKEFPETVRILYDYFGNNSGHRYIIHKQFLIFYVIYEEKLVVVRVFHRLQNYMKILFDE